MMGYNLFRKHSDERPVSFPPSFLYLRDKVIESDDGTRNVQWRIENIRQIVRKAVIPRESRLFHPILVSLRCLVVVILF
jgi:hypothetical protein